MGLPYQVICDFAVKRDFLCSMSKFPPTFIKLCLACEELVSNAKYSRFGGHFIYGLVYYEEYACMLYRI